MYMFSNWKVIKEMGGVLNVYFYYMGEITGEE
ncbi:hypothetical protein N781_14870 [Pontibacillus halophilus JSM 076056 = DSM 19796]|uniref:Uncharacterized protein n=1 Tax=Pontibacillus halophilus JSM 076056 = DSM 19796 TaxID=1385510 RepID=A0A0A5IAB4_9BACI|nr:hypothetical protein N781_14870 [Pontibacillus halophilus JSM 076056 = DSM 19796]